MYNSYLKHYNQRFLTLIVTIKYPYLWVFWCSEFCTCMPCFDLLHPVASCLKFTRGYLWFHLNVEIIEELTRTLFKKPGGYCCMFSHCLSSSWLDILFIEVVCKEPTTEPTRLLRGWGHCRSRDCTIHCTIMHTKRGSEKIIEQEWIIELNLEKQKVCKY